MRLLRTEITPLINDALFVEYRDQPYLASPFHGQPCFHAHPELELVLILEGYGKRIIGDKVEPFESGDMVFIGSNVPHIWLSDPAFYKEDPSLKSRVIVTYFNPSIFQQMFDSVKEFEGIREMIAQASKGIKIFGETRRIIAEKLEHLAAVKGFEKIEALLRIMHLISISSEKVFIADTEVNEFENQHSDKLMDVITFIKCNLHEQISLKQVAGIACLTEQSFCRYFKKRTKMSFSQYLLELRMNHARKVLIESDKPISEVASMCGYNSSSHFCKVFRDYTGQSPYQYKSGIKNAD
ncbi:helix-turn-helix domain-containing protein [Chitinophaga sp. SYP-B3965]|uniref:AraC family transcriptional regulator n=1 Tax=Chitinophaga sp. SYP-B3965 TaxID=2663120 RepID=UPI00129985B1|nr:AraC family transcriptional regulator [Chitinophaga sp. SYP-B3965]MRG45253.1 helix-turn-helix domain-containing protein [Chitinophaga sp. SYP-B3965]